MQTSIKNNTFINIISNSRHPFGTSPAYEIDIVQNKLENGTFSSRYVLRNKINGSYVLISDREAFIWNALDTNPNLKRLVYIYARTFKSLDFNFIFKVLQNWLEKHILLPRNKALQTASKKNQPHSFLFQNLINTELVFPRFTKLLDLFAVVLSRVIKLPFVFISVIGFCISAVLVFISFLFFQDQFLLFTDVESNTLNSIVFSFIVIFFSVTIHELGHAVAMRATGLRVKRAGFKLLFGIPFFFVDTNEAWTRSRIKRILISSAGIIANLGILGVAFLLSVVITDPVLSNLAFFIAYVNGVLALINLIPFIELDGYYILIDILKTPNLIERSREVLVKSIKSLNIDKKEIGFIFFGLLYLPTLLLFLVLTADFFVKIVRSTLH